MEQIEIEYKILINEDIYNKIISDYQDKISESFNQTNYYFTCDKLNILKYMLRIRELNNTYELTLKRPNKIGRKEFNIPLSFEDKEKIFNNQTIDNEIFDILNKVSVKQNDLKQEHQLTTYRSNIYLPLGVLSVDKNTYNNHIDYEIEFEVNDALLGRKEFLRIIDKYNLTYTINCMSKYMRMKDSYKNKDSDA